MQQLDEVTQLKAEAYDLNKQLAVLSSAVQQMAAVLSVSTLDAMYEEILRLKEVEKQKLDSE